MCYTPINITSDGANYTVPCGKCEKCTKRRASGWSFRLMAEERYCTSAFFITLTYDNQTKQINRTSRGFLSLSKRHLQLYFKRLRKLHPKNSLPIRYYAVGEYGTNTYRPHYHIILFNAFQEHIAEAWKTNGIPIGHVHFGRVSKASVGYTLKYISKPKRVPMHKNDDRIPEFSLMSKNWEPNMQPPQ